MEREILLKKVRLKQLALEFTAKDNELFAYLHDIGLQLRTEALSQLANCEPTNTTEIYNLQLKAAKSKLLFDLLDIVIADGHSAQDTLATLDSPGYD